MTAAGPRDVAARRAGPGNGPDAALGCGLGGAARRARAISHPGQRGFTLVELVIVIMIAGIIAATLTVFLRPAIENYLASRARADLTDQAETAVRRMVRDVRVAVPNSIRTPGAQCFELIPTSTGGRYRSGPDTVNDALPCTASTCAAALDTTQATTLFDVLTPLSATPAIGDWVVVGNQNPGDVYAGVNRAAITSFAASAPNAAFGRHRIGVASTQFPIGYDGGRFSVVPASQRAVFYVCSGADGTLDAAGNGKGTLYRLMNYGFNASHPAACPATAGADVLATRVRACSFVYDPNLGATQQNGFVWMQLDVARNNESAHLAVGAHVSNAP
jgi:MSHA biogenesis protein MshO